MTGSNKGGVEHLAEARDSVGQDNAVDAVLQVGVLVAYVDLAARHRILRHAGGLQEDLAHLRVGALGRRLKRLLI